MDSGHIMIQNNPFLFYKVDFIRNYFIAHYTALFFRDC
jgi:hypothetical protein